MAGPTDREDAQVSVADMVKQLSEQTSRLAWQEVELAKAELVAKGKRAGIGAGLFGAAGILGFYAFGGLVATVILALAKAGVTTWLAALIVTVVLAAIAGVAALQGRSNVQQATPPIPEQATESVKEDVEWTTQRAKAGRQ